MESLRQAWSAAGPYWALGGHITLVAVFAWACLRAGSGSPVGYLLVAALFYWIIMGISPIDFWCILALYAPPSAVFLLVWLVLSPTPLEDRAERLLLQVLGLSAFAFSLHVLVFYGPRALLRLFSTFWRK